MIAVAGEALIDLVAQGGVLRPFAGGGPFNTAVGLARLGVPVGFLGRLSDDHFGLLLESRLAESGVDRRYVLHGAAPTPLAVVHAQGHDAVYRFYLSGTAYADLATSDLPELSDDVAALHLGTLALATDPPATVLEALMQREAGRRLVVVDPNVRLGVVGDMTAYRERFERWASLAHVIKLSAADASRLYPELGPEHALERVLECGARLAVLTLGPNGAVARNARGRAAVGSPPVVVVDTVGAGDAFGAGLLCRLWNAGRLDLGAVGELDGAQLEDALTFAATVAAIVCSRAGAWPPTLAEVEAFGLSRTP